MRMHTNNTNKNEKLVYPELSYLVNGICFEAHNTLGRYAKEDYYQAQRYLQASGIKLALLVNFRNRYLKPVRIIRIDTDTKSRFQ